MTFGGASGYNPDMDLHPSELPDDVDALKARVVAAEAGRRAAEALIAHLKLVIAKLRRDKFGPSAERTSRLLDQLELQLVELEASASEDELAAEKGSAEPTTVVTFQRKRPVKKP